MTSVWASELKGNLFFSLSAKQERKIVDWCPSNNKGWKKKFLYVSTAGLYGSNPESVVAVPSVWASELKGKDNPLFFLFLMP